MQVKVKCPRCGDTGRADEENARLGVECPSCGTKFVSDARPGFWERQAERSEVVRYPWLLPVLALGVLAFALGVPIVAIVVLVAVGALVVIAAALWKIANRQGN